MKSIAFYLALLTSSHQVIASPELHSRETHIRRQLPPSCDCTGTNNVNSTLYLCGDPRLGPLTLPTNISYSNIDVADLLNPYNRLGGLCPSNFLTKWTDSSRNFVYPPLNGYQLDVNGAPIQSNVLLPVGFLMDRFGSEYGTFTGPVYAPYIQRSLPPSNLDTDPNNPQYPYNYHIYNVTKPLLALSGPIAPWFGQAGQGVQYQFSVNILTLVNGGYLQRVVSQGT